MQSWLVRARDSTECDAAQPGHTAFKLSPCRPARPARLDACAIAGILQGSIATWDDPALTALNPQVGGGGRRRPEARPRAAGSTRGLWHSWSAGGADPT